MVGQQSQLGGVLHILMCCLLATVLIAGPSHGGEGVAANDLLARAHSGDHWAQLNLGAAFDHGLAGFPVEPARAVAWYRRAAEGGVAEAQFNLAHCLATAHGTERDDEEAFVWMLRAAGQGLASAQFLAGAMLADGVGTAADRAGALVWLQRAADGGNHDAAELLRQMTEAASSD